MVVEDEILDNVIMIMFDGNDICFKRKFMDTII